MLQRILNFSLFGENFKNVNLPVFIKEGMVSIILYLFEKLCVHVKLVIYTMNATFKLSFQIHFTINMLSATRILAYCRLRVFIRIEKHFLHFAMQFWM